MTAIFKPLLALALIAAPLPAYAQSAPEQRTVTLEDVCNGGATEFTDEHSVRVRCPTEGDPQAEYQRQRDFEKAARVADAEWAEFHRLFCDDSIFSAIADDTAGLSSEAAEEDRRLICAPENRP